MTYLSEEIHPQHIGLSMGLYIGGNAIGGMSGRLISGVLVDFISWHAALAVLGGLALVAALVFWRVLPESKHFRPAPLKPATLLNGYRLHFRDAGLPWLFLIGFLLMGSFVTLFNYIGYRLLAEPYHMSQAVVGVLSVVYLSGIYSSAWVGSLADKLGRRKVLWAVILLMLGGLLLTLFEPIPLMLAGLLLFTFGFFGAHSVASSWIGRRALRAKGQASSLYLFSYYVGSSLAGTLGGCSGITTAGTASGCSSARCWWSRYWSRCTWRACRPCLATPWRRPPTEFEAPVSRRLHSDQKRTPVSSSDSAHSRAASQVARIPRNPRRCRITAGFQPAIRADIGAAIPALFGQRGKCRQRPHLRRLRERSVGHLHRPAFQARTGHRRCRVLQVGRRVARMRRQALQKHAPLAGAALQLQAEQQIGLLAVAIGEIAVVAALGVEVVERQPAELVETAGHTHHPGPWSGQQRVQQQSRKREVAKVIGAHLHLETVAGTPQGQEHHSGVVEQEIEAFVALAETGGAGADRGEVGQVEIGQLQACLGILVEDRPPRPLRLFAIAAGHHHGCPFAGQRAPPANPGRCWRR